MTYIVRYIHKLEQLTGLLRDGISGLLHWQGNLRAAILIKAMPPAELDDAYAQYLADSVVHVAVTELYKLVEELKADSEITDMTELQDDLLGANEMALKLCQTMLENSRLLQGYRQ